jgi:hypothetical protein
MKPYLLFGRWYRGNMTLAKWTIWCSSATYTRPSWAPCRWSTSIKNSLCSSHIFLTTIGTSLQYPLSVIIAQLYGHHSYNEVAIVFSAQQAPM